MRITIIEFAPCADLIYHVRRHPEEGYLSGDADTVTVRSGAKLRPRMVSSYAGGKATNVARVIDKLLRPDEAVEIELVVFRPDSPEGRYIQDLQSRELARVRVEPVIVEGRLRMCLDLTDPDTDPAVRVGFNISPRCVWGDGAMGKALEYASRLSTDLLLLAGNPPVVEASGELASDLYARIIELSSGGAGSVSVDTEKRTLASCLAGEPQPHVVKINEAEYVSVAPGVWKDFVGTLIVTDSAGCRVWRPGEPVARVAGAGVAKLYSTIGAGDAVHAGFTVARWVRDFDEIRAARFGQAAAAAAVSSPEGTRGVLRQTVDELFAELERDS